MSCRICGSESVQSTHKAREMMHGSGEEFSYFQCGDCGCLQIAEFPADMAPYYGQSYYSVRPQNPVKRFLQEQRTRYIAGSGNMVGRAVAAVKPPERDESIAPDGVARDARILEVGCGNGYYLHKLLELGFRRLSGVDPFMDPEYVRSAPICLRRLSLMDLDTSEEQYDCIVFGHTFEHIAEQHETMARVRDLLPPGGLCVLRIPWADSLAWEHYRTDWVQLDAPRHFFLHTRRSLQVVADRAGLRIERVVHDSTAFQFWGSEQYRRGIPLHSRNSCAIDPARSVFTESQVQDYEERAQALNSEGRGDQVTAYLRKGEG